MDSLVNTSTLDPHNRVLVEAMGKRLRLVLTWLGQGVAMAHADQASQASTTDKALDRNNDKLKKGVKKSQYTGHVGVQQTQHKKSHQICDMFVEVYNASDISCDAMYGYSERLQIQPSRVTTTKPVQCNTVDHTRYPKLNGWQGLVIMASYRGHAPDMSSGCIKVSDGYTEFLYCFQLLVLICGIRIQPQPAMRDVWELKSWLVS